MEQAASDLKAASLAVDKLGHVFDNFQSHAFSILALSEQWRNLQGSFSIAESSFSTHSKLLESKERQFGALSTNLDNLQQEAVFRQRKLESAEKSVCERIEAAAIREKHIQEFRDVVELEKGRVCEQSKALKCREKRFEARCVEVEEREKRLEARCVEVEEREKRLEARCVEVEEREKLVDEVRDKLADEVRLDVEGREKQIEERCQVAEVKEREIDERCEAVELEEERNVKRWIELEKRGKEMDLRERNLNEAVRVVELKEKEMNEGLERKLKEFESRRRHMFREIREGLDLRENDIDLKEKCLNERTHELHQTQKEVNECFKVRCKELELRELQLEETREALELGEREIGLKEKDLIDRAQSLESKEKELNEAFKENSKDRNEIGLRELHLNKLAQEFELKEKELNGAFEVNNKELKKASEALELKVREMDLKEKDLIDKARSLELKEKELKEAFKENSKDRNEIDLRELHLNQRAQEFELKEKELNGAFEVNNKELKKASKALELKQKKMDLKEKDLIDRARSLGLKEKKLNEALKENSKDRNEIDLRELHLNQRAQEFELKEKEMDSRELHLNERAQKIELKQKELNQAFKGNSKDLKLKQVQTRKASEALKFKGNEMELKEKQMNERIERLELKEKEADEHSQALELKEKKLNETIAAMESKVKQTDQGCKKMDLKDKEISVYCEEKLIDARGTQINEPSEAQLLQENRVGEHHCISSKLSSLFRNMDTHGVRLFLIKLAEKELDILQIEISNALRFAVDPPKLVLDVCRLHETNTAEYDAFRHKAMFLFEALMNITPNITADEKDRATSYAVTWRARLKNTRVDSCGFLLFVAAYKLATSFDACDLFQLFRTLYLDHEFYRPGLHIKVCCALGIWDKIPGHIGSFIGRKKWLEAVRLICLFKMECHFPPVPMLNAHVEFVRQEIEKIPNIGTTIQTAENVKKEILALETLLKFLHEFNLTSQISTDSILGYMRQLETMSRTTESYIKVIKSSGDINANSQNKECNNSSGHAVFRPVNFQAELQVGLKHSLTPPECQAEKRPRVQVFNHVTPPCSTTSAPWPQPGPCSFGQATNVYVIPHLTSTWPSVPFPDSAIGSRPNLSPIQQVAPLHMENYQHVAPLHMENYQHVAPQHMENYQHVAPLHMENYQHVAPPAYLGGAPLPFYGGNGEAFLPPRMP